MTTPAPPGVPVFPAGYGPDPADMDSWVKTPLTFATNKITFRAEARTAVAVSASTFTVVTYDTVLEDPYSGWSSSNHRWVAPYTGFYEVTVTNMIAVVNGVMISSIGLTGTNPMYSGTEVQVFTTMQGGSCAQSVVPMIGGVDYVQGVVWSTVATSTSTTNEGRYPNMQIVFWSE